MKILILSFHYPPDLSAGSFRIEALVEQLSDNILEKGLIDILTTSPHRYSQFQIDGDGFVTNKNTSISRINVYRPNGGVLSQSFTFLKYVNFVFRKTRHKDYDVIFATSSKLMTAVLGAYLSKKKKTPLYLDIRDLFADTIKDIYPGWRQWFLQPIFSNLERWSFNKATHLNIVSGGFKAYVNEKTKTKNISVHTNGIDELFMSNFHKHKRFSKTIDQPYANQKCKTILYAGNIGEGQGLDLIIPSMSQYLGENYLFKIIGDGRRLSILKKNISEANIKNVEFHPPVEREKLLREYELADILFLHLNNNRAFDKVIPSKLFEFAATGKPILAGVSGFSAKFIKDNIKNCEVFKPCDAELAIKAMKRLNLSYQNRQKFILQFQRKEIMKRMSSELIELVDKNKK